MLVGVYVLCFLGDDGVTFSIDLGVIAILNFVLGFILEDKYSTICYWIFAYTFVASIVWFLYGMVEAFDDLFIVIDVIAFICNIILLIFFVIYSKGIFTQPNLSYVEEQCVIGACLIVVITICLFLICYQIDEMVVYDQSATALIILIVVAVLNYILAFTLKNDYRIICYWLAPASIVGMIIDCFSVDDVDMPTPIAVMATNVNVILLIIYCFIDKYVFI